MVVILSFIIGIIFFIMSVNSSVTVIFNIPNLLQNNIPYSLFIQSTNLHERFPFENFALSFELVNPRTNESIGIAAVTTSEYKGDEYRGFSIGKFAIQENTIEMILTFRKEAYDTLLIIRYSIEKTEEQKQQFFDDKSKGIIYQHKINLYLPYTIAMQARPEMGVINNEDKVDFGFHLVPEKYGFLTCEATEGLPKVNPQFVNADLLRGAVERLVKTGMNSLQWRVVLDDHGKIIQCRAGGDVQNLTLTVYHYVSEVLTSPPIANKVSRKSQLKCISKDGYPTPKNTWAFLTGPTESWKFYQLRDNNVTLFINSTAPINSNWSFECRGMNEMPAVVQKYLATPLHSYPIRKIFNFTIIDSDEAVQSSQIGITIVIVFLVIVLSVLVVLCVINRSKVHIIFNQYSRVFRSDELDKPSNTKIPSETSYKGGDGQRNGTEDTAYADIVAIVQSKGSCDPAMGPIHVV